MKYHAEIAIMKNYSSPFLLQWKNVHAFDVSVFWTVALLFETELRCHHVSNRNVVIRKLVWI